MKKILDQSDCVLYHGNALECIDEIKHDMIQCCITSPTYWGKRQFTNNKKEFGIETLEEYVDKNIQLYSKILNKMKPSGSLYVVIQDSFMGSGISRTHHNHWENNKDQSWIRNGLHADKQGNTSCVTAHHKTIRSKSLCGIPFRIAIGLVDMGYIWRENIIWEKPNPMPDNAKDRVRNSSEYVLHFTKNTKYKFDPESYMVNGNSGKKRFANQVWMIPTQPKKNHTATFPEKLVEKLLLATTDKGDTVFEPFLGSATMLELAQKNNRQFIGCDINKEFVINSKNICIYLYLLKRYRSSRYLIPLVKRESLNV